MLEAARGQQVPSEHEGVDMSLVEAQVDRVFPHRNRDGSPSYRKHQREAIMNILTAFLVSDKGFVALDGPVGSGKSAICYTVGRVLGSTVYLTPQKQLQDQIAREHWSHVKMVKGKSAYACNHCGLDNNNIRCTYNGDRYHMCNNSASSYRPRAGSYQTIQGNIEEVIDRFGSDDRLLRMRSGFEPDDDVPKVFEEIRRWVANRDEERGTLTTHPIPVAIGCVMGPRECPVRSSRMLAKLAGIKLLNPDVFYMLNRGIEPAFPWSELMIIDECHTLESVIQRIFQAKLPLDTLKELFGVDITNLYDCETSSDFAEKFIYAVKTYLGPTLAAASTISKMGDVTGVEDYDSLQEMKSQNQFAVALKMVSGRIMNHGGKFSMLEIANHAFMDSQGELPEFLKPLHELIRVYFMEQCDRYGCETKIDITAELIPACERFCNRVGWDPEECPDRQMSKHIVTLRKALDAFMDNVANLVSMKNGDYESFVLGKTPRASTRFTCAGTELESVVKQYYTFDHVDRVIEVVPIATGVLLKAFFYHKAHNVLLSTGTWVDLKGMFRVFGIDRDDVEYIRVPSSFVAKRRPVFVISDKNFTDFSQKLEQSKEYVYKTNEGIRKFCAELSGTIEKVRGFIAEKHGEDANVVVHCHTYDIARKIAEFCPIVDGSFLIHLSQGSMPIRNCVTNWRSEFVPKDELLQHLMRHPNSGLTLVSASVSEGVDFKYGVARAQILLKRPTPYLGSPYVKAYYRGNEEVGVRKDPNYLDRVTFTEITQQYGRVMRADDDWGYTIIMDQALVKSLYHILSSRGDYRVKDLNLTYFASGVQGDRDMRGLPRFSWPFDG